MKKLDKLKKHNFSFQEMDISGVFFNIKNNVRPNLV